MWAALCPRASKELIWIHSWNTDNSSARWAPCHRPFSTEEGPELVLLPLLMVTVAGVSSLWTHPTQPQCRPLQPAWLWVRPYPILLCLPPQGFWKSPGLPGGGAALPVGAVDLARRALKVRQTAAGPAARPFLLSLCVQALLIWGTRPLYAAPALPGRLSHPGWGFPFHLALGALLRARRQEGSTVSQNLGDSAFSAALWPRSCDILSGNLDKGQAGAAGR